jgi:hypothetical protein
MKVSTTFLLSPRANSIVINIKHYNISDLHKHDRILTWTLEICSRSSSSLKIMLVPSKNLLSKCTSEGAYKNYDMVVPSKNAAWNDVWSEFAKWVIVLYVKRGLGEVHDKPIARMSHAVTCLDGLMRWGSKLSPDTMVHLLQESCINNWQGALCRWLFSNDCNNNMISNMSTHSVCWIGGRSSSTSTLYRTWHPGSGAWSSFCRIRNMTCSTVWSPSGRLCCPCIR